MHRTITVILILFSLRCLAQQQEKWGDQGDSTYANPVLPGDYSDVDAIRVGTEYYAISSTLQFSPGMIILHSADLVNWKILGHAVGDLTQIGPALNWNRMNRYGKGIWAGSIRFHQGRFWIYFCTPDEGFFMTTAENPAGPWQPLHKIWGISGWDDCCPFWDDDGQGYLIASHFADAYSVHLFKMTAGGRQLEIKSDNVIHQSRGSEANKLYKINGLYYHFFSEVHQEGRVAMMERSKNIYGPYEAKQLNHVNPLKDKEPNQGGLIQANSGGWWFFTHQGTGDWEGRAACLLPVTWISGWPIIGKPGQDTIGNMVWADKNPDPGLAISSPQSSDDFNQGKLGVQWEWNYQPRKEKWSLAEHPGFLRLHAFPPVRPLENINTLKPFFKAGNTLSQRSMRTVSSDVLIKINISGMANGQRAGLCHFSAAYSCFGIKQVSGIRRLMDDENGTETPGPVIKQKIIWLKSSWSYDGISHYAYSLDGKKFIPFGNGYALSWGFYRGDRVGLFSYNMTKEKGNVDVDYFHYDYANGHADNNP